MTNITARIASIATLALAALPMAAIATTSHAATATVQVSDLNLDSATGLATFQQRADVATRSFCTAKAPGRSLSAQAACEKAVRAEVGEKLANMRQAQMAAQATVVAAR